MKTPKRRRDPLESYLNKPGWVLRNVAREEPKPVSTAEVRARFEELNAMSRHRIILKPGRVFFHISDTGWMELKI